MFIQFYRHDHDLDRDSHFDDHDVDRDFGDVVLKSA